MPLYSYKKAEYKRRTYANRKYRTNIVLELQEEPLTLWKLLNGLGNDLKKILTTSKLIGTLVPAIFIFYGLYLLANQFTPALLEKLREELGYYDQGTTALVAGDYISAKVQYLSNPGAEYFQQLQNNAFSDKKLLADEISNNYKGVFKLSIPNLGLNELPVQANVDSGIEEVYDKVLEKGLAHMESTGLPISDINNNIVIYGHSAGGDFYNRTGDPAAAFSRLNKAKVGDEIVMKIDGKEYTYKITKTKIVKPDDISIVTGDNTFKQTLTLFTCYPAGNNSNRLVVIANPVNN
jgi:LPXTG-site transpeptidase (sortase) family protein